MTCKAWFAPRRLHAIDVLLKLEAAAGTGAVSEQLEAMLNEIERIEAIEKPAVSCGVDFA